jgi:hypothetical protein
MSDALPNESGGNYFALSRFIRKLRGGDATRSEGNWIEMYFAGATVYFISYLFAANLLIVKLPWWKAALVLIVLIFAVWIAWLILLYFDSLIVKLCWRCGLFTDLPRTRVQSVLMGIVTTVLAAQLLTAGPWLSWIGLLWIGAVSLNLAAALLLALFYEEPR